MSLELKAFGKVNLALDVLGRRPNGYHDVRMIMQTVTLHDTLEFTKTGTGEGIVLESDSDAIPLNEDNLIYKAADLLMKEFHITEGVKIKVIKRLPVAAGMAGGSSDCAATLKGINALFGLGLNKQQLRERGVKLGADVPYCIMGGTCLAEGIGEILTRLEDVEASYVLIAKPPIGVSTRYVYEQIDSKREISHPDIDGMLEDIQGKAYDQLFQKMGNVLSLVTEQKYPEIAEIRRRMIENGAVNALMSGSGPTVFGIFDEEEKMQLAKQAIDESGLTKEVFVTQFAPCADQ